jgi:hypothetical protein
MAEDVKDISEEEEGSFGIEAMDDYEDDSTKPLDIIKEYITKDIRERSELNRTEIRGMAMLYSVATELNWVFTKEFCEQFLHFMRSHTRQGIKEDVQLLSGMVTQVMPLGYSMPYSMVNPEQQEK